MMFWPLQNVPVLLNIPDLVTMKATGKCPDASLKTPGLLPQLGQKNVPMCH